MLNLVVIEGVIVQRWTHDLKTYFRMGSQREPGLPRKDGGEDSDYLTVIVEPGPIPVHDFNVNRRVRVTGFLQSRGYPEPLKKALSKANGLTAPLREKLTPELIGSITIPRVTNELIAQSIVFVDGSTQRPANTTPNQARRQERQQPTTQRVVNPVQNGPKAQNGGMAETPALQAESMVG